MIRRSLMFVFKRIGKVIRSSNPNPWLSTYKYNIEFDVGQSLAYFANTFSLLKDIVK